MITYNEIMEETLRFYSSTKPIIHEGNWTNWGKILPRNLLSACVSVSCQYMKGLNPVIPRPIINYEILAGG